MFDHFSDLVTQKSDDPASCPYQHDVGPLLEVNYDERINDEYAQDSDDVPYECFSFDVFAFVKVLSGVPGEMINAIEEADKVEAANGDSDHSDPDECFSCFCEVVLVVMCVFLEVGLNLIHASLQTTI